MYLAIPPELPQPPGWSPRPDHASEVAQLYRTHLGLTHLSIGPEQLRFFNPVFLLLAGLAYVVVVWSRPEGVPLRSLVTVCAPVAFASLLMPPLYATDIFFYGVSGEIVERFSGNPYVLTPADIPDAALLGFNYWTSITSPYGPIWTSVSVAAAAISSADPFLCTLVLKAVGLAGVLASAALIWKFLKCTEPRAARFGVMLFVLNPCVWLLAVGDGHLDMLMAALMVGAAYLLARGHKLGAWCGITFATLVKYLTAPLLLVFFLARLSATATFAARVRVSLILGVCFVVAAAASWAPYWVGPSTLSSLIDEGGRGYAEPVLLVLEAVGLPDGLLDLTAKLMLAGLLTWMVWAIRASLSGSTGVVAEVRTWALTMAAIPALLPRSHPWYVLTAMALLAAVHPRTRTTTIVVYVAAGAWFLWRVGRI